MYHAVCSFIPSPSTINEETINLLLKYATSLNKNFDQKLYNKLDELIIKIYANLININDKTLSKMIS